MSVRDTGGEYQATTVGEEGGALFSYSDLMQHVVMEYPLYSSYSSLLLLFTSATSLCVCHRTSSACTN